MSPRYGYVKCKVLTTPRLVPSRHGHETQYHLHSTLGVPADAGDQRWDSAINVGTNDSDDLLKYRIAMDFHHPILEALAAADAGFHDLTTERALPALDFLRSDILAETGPWRNSGVMDGSAQTEPAVTLIRLLETAKEQQADVYIFGRAYTSGGLGIHDVHMNQGSGGSFMNNGNAIWQDGAVLVNLGDDNWAGYFTAFTQQTVPTDDRGNPTPGGHPINDSDPGSLVGQQAAALAVNR